MSNAREMKALRRFEAMLDKADPEKEPHKPIRPWEDWSKDRGEIRRFVDHLVGVRGRERRHMMQLIHRSPDPLALKSVLDLLMKKMTEAKDLPSIRTLVELAVCLGPTTILPLLDKCWRPPVNEPREVCLLATLALLLAQVDGEELDLAIRLMQRPIGWFAPGDANAGTAARIVRNAILMFMNANPHG